jgi:hypothetical protein
MLKSAGLVSLAVTNNTMCGIKILARSGSNRLPLPLNAGFLSVPRPYPPCGCSAFWNSSSSREACLGGENGRDGFAETRRTNKLAQINTPQTKRILLLAIMPLLHFS